LSSASRRLVKLLADQTRAWFNQCAATTSRAKGFEDCVDAFAKAAKAADIIDV